MGLFSKLKSPVFGGNAPAYAPPSPPRQPNNPDPRILPSGWISQFDPNSQKFFYVYTPTGLRQWEHPADRPFINANRGYAPQQPAQGYAPQPQYGQPQYGQPQYGQPQYVQQPMGSRMGGGGGMGMGTMAAVGIGGGLLGYAIGDAIGDSHEPDIIENNYYDNDGGGFDGGGFDGGGFDDF